MDSRTVEQQPRPLDLTKVERIVFLDIDRTLILTDIEDEVVYTGYSVDRWRAFVEALKADGNLVGIITNKDRGLVRWGAPTFSSLVTNVFNGLPNFPPQEISSRYDDMCLRLLGYDGV